MMMTDKMNGRPFEVTASHTYLGIGINNKLSWAEYISNTVSKANKILGLLCQNLNSFSPFVKETAYKTLVRPKLEYCSSIWDPTTRSMRISLNQFNIELQDVCEDIRRQGYISDMLRYLNWKTLAYRRTISRLKLLYKSVHNIVAINIDEHYANHEKNITTRKTSSNILFRGNAQYVTQAGCPSS